MSAELDHRAPPRLPGERATERACQDAIVAAARIGGWRVLAIRPAVGRKGRWQSPIQGDPGFPDLTLVHPRLGLRFVELKRWPNKLEPAQEAWKVALDAAGAKWRLVWVPEELRSFCQELAEAGR